MGDVSIPAAYRAGEFTTDQVLADWQRKEATVTHRLAVFGSVSLLAVALAVVPHVAASQNDQSSPVPLEGVVIETLAATPSFWTEYGLAAIKLQRITLQPGSTLDLDYPGPVLCFIERGTLGVILAADGTQQVIYAGRQQDGSPPPLTITNGEETLLTQGYAIYSSEGDLGRTRCADDEPTVILAVLIVPEPDPSEVDGETAEETAQPAADASPDP